MANITVKVKLFAAVRETVGQREIAMTLAPGTSVEEVLRRLVQQYPTLAEIAPSCRMVVNLQYVGPESLLADGDEVALIPPVSGGEWFEVTDEPLQAGPLIEAVAKDTAGAIVTFVGVVRGFSRGKRVRFLEYEAYREMAEEILAKIGREIAMKWGLSGVAIQHRVGHLEIGETAVVIAVSAPHRQEAFAACEEAIDRLKKDVPIWKKEVWEDGEVWVGWEGG